MIPVRLLLFGCLHQLSVIDLLSFGVKSSGFVQRGKLFQHLADPDMLGTDFLALAAMDALRGFPVVHLAIGQDTPTSTP